MQLFYLADCQNVTHFDEDESKHIVRVLRKEVGDTLHLTDGKGYLYTAIITDAHPKKCQFRIQELSYTPPRPFAIHLAIAPTKNIDRIEWMLEKAVEMGIEEITFLNTAHSERKQINLERLEKVAISAAKQSLKMYVPVLHEMISYKQFLKQCTADQKWIAHLEEGERLPLHKAIRPQQKYCILIGPEGDFAPEEIDMAKEAGFGAVTLGESRLRTETAGLAACFTLNLVNEMVGK